MSTSGDAEGPRTTALELLSGSRWGAGTDQARQARELLPALWRHREFDLLVKLGERIARFALGDPLIRRVQVQGLIETGQLTAAIDVARAAVKGLPEDHTEWSELHGLIGRAYKQMVMDSTDPGDAASRAALREAVKAYTKPYARDTRNTWHAINLAAVSAFARRAGIRSTAKPDVRALATGVIKTLSAKPARAQDHWDAATLAEASLALDDLDGVERHLKTYLTDTRVSAFNVGSTLRQFSQVWGLKDSADARMQGILQALRARLITLPGAQMDISAAEVTRQRTQTAPDKAQLEAILGRDGTVSFDWWKIGLDRARAVGAVYAGIGQRIGTCFLVRSSELKLNGADERLVLTNFHVINPTGSGGALRPEDAQIVFEAASTQRYDVKDVLWSSPADKHDACLLRLSEEPDIVPLPLSPTLPVVDESARVFAIGYPAGGGLEFSFQDNALLDHEGPQNGKPSDPQVWRVHYRAPTEKGSSGSPVFNRSGWKVIALHHAGGTLSQLNGKPGTYPANEGIALASIIEAIR